MRHFLIAILSAALLAACTPAGSGEKPALAVTIEPYRFIVEAIAGDVWEVFSVVPAGTSPETFDPSPSHIMRLSRSRAYFLTGGIGFESRWSEKIAALCNGLPISDTSQGVERDEDDPHLWTSPDNMVVIARNICAALCRMDSADAAGYKARLQSAEKMIAATDTAIRSKLAALSCRNFLVFHPSLTYFARLYGVNQIALEEHGKEPSAAHVKHIIDEARRLGIRNVFVQAEFDKNHAVTIARELDAAVQTINPLSYDWHGEMLHVADCLNK